MDYKEKKSFSPIETYKSFDMDRYESRMTVNGSLSFTCPDTLDMLYRVLMMNKPTIIKDTTTIADYFLMEVRELFSRKKYDSIIIHSDGDTCRLYATISKNVWILIGKFKDSELSMFDKCNAKGVLDKSIIAYRDLHYYFAKDDYLYVHYKFKKVVNHLI